MTVASLFAELGVDTSPMSDVSRDVESRLAPLQATFQRVGTNLTKYVTAPIVGVGAAAIATGTKVENSFAQIVGLVGESREVLEGMRGEMLDIGAATGQGPGELAEALFFVESAGFRGTEALEVLRASAMAATGGLGTVASVADAVTSAVNAYGPATLSAARATDVLVATVREGKIEADAIASSLGRVTGIAAELGVPFEDVGATLATLTRVGASAEQGVTALASTLRTILKPSQGAEDALRDAGLSIEELRSQLQSEGLFSTLQNLRTSLEASGQELTDVFENAESLTAVFALLGKNTEQAEQIFNSMANTIDGATQKAFEAATETLTGQWNRALATAKNLAVELYVEFAGPLTSALKTVADVVDRARGAWNNLSPALRKAAIVTAGVAAAIGPVLVGLTGVLAILPTLTAAFGLLQSALPIIAGLGTAAGFVYDKWDELAAFFTTGAGSDLFTEVKKAALTMADSVKAAFSQIVQAGRTLWSTLTTLFEGSGTGIIAMIGSNLVEAFRLAVKVGVPVFDQLMNIVGAFAQLTANAVSIIVSLLQGDFAGAFSTVKDSVGVWYDFMLRTFTNLADMILTFVEEVINVLPYVDVEFTSMRETIAGWRKSLVSDTKDAQKNLTATMGPVESLADSFTTLREEAEETGDEVVETAERIEGAVTKAVRAATAMRAAGTVDNDTGRGSVQRDPEGRNRAKKLVGASVEEIEALRRQAMPLKVLFEDIWAGMKNAGLTALDTVGMGLEQLIMDGNVLGREINSIGEAFKSFAQIAKRAIKQVLAELAAAVAKALIFRAVMSAVGGGAPTGFIGSVTSILGGGGPGGRTRSFGGAVPSSLVQGARTQTAAVIELGQPVVLPNGDLQFSIDQSSQNQTRRGFPDQSDVK